MIFFVSKLNNTLVGTSFGRRYTSVFPFIQIKKNSRSNAQDEPFIISGHTSCTKMYKVTCKDGYEEVVSENSRSVVQLSKWWYEPEHFKELRVERDRCFQGFNSCLSAETLASWNYFSSS